MIHYINDIMLIKQAEQEVASMLEVCAPESRKLTLWRIRDPSLKGLDAQCSEEC